MNILPLSPSDQLGTLLAPYAEVHGNAVYIGGVAAAQITRATDTFGPLTDTTANDATNLKHGFLSRLDKIKLDAINLAAITDGDMLKANYDPGNVGGNAFALSNMQGTLASSQIGDGQVTIAKLAPISTASFLGRVTGGTGAVEVLTAGQVLTALGIEAGATADQTGAEIKAIYEAEADTNAFTDSEKTKLAGVASGAEVNVQSDWNASSGDAHILNKPTLGSAAAQNTSAFDAAGTAATRVENHEIQGDTVHGITGFGTNFTQGEDLAQVLSTTGLNASTLPYTPATLSNWTDGLDPGNTNGALDQIATRVTAVEATPDPPAPLTLGGTPDYITLADNVLTRNQIDLTTDVTGVLPIANIATGTPDGSKFVRDDGTLQAIPGGGDALVANTLDQFADVTQAGGATLAISASTTLAGGNHSGTNTGDNAVNSLYSGLVSNATHTGDVTGATALTIADGAVTEAKCNSTINASLDLADSSIQPGNAALTDERVPTAAGLTSKFGTSKATIVDGDKIAILDSAAADAPKHSLFSLVKSTLKTYFDTLYAATLGADDNYVTDAEKIVIGNTSGTNTGDQNLSGYVLTTAIDTLAELNGIITDATLIDTNDARLSDARTPTAHSHEGTAILSTGETGGTKFLREDGDGTSSWQTPPLQAALPAGLVSPYAGTTAPSGWLLCAGQTVSRTTYADLFAAVSTTYGAGDGSTTFALPDLRGRVPAGKDNMGGTDAARLTNALTGGVDGDTLGAVGGDDGHQLTVAQLAAHGHTINTRLRTSSLTANDTNRAELGDTSNSTSTSASMAASTGGNAEHNNVQPTIILNYIIKT